MTPRSRLPGSTTVFEFVSRRNGRGRTGSRLGEKVAPLADAIARAAQARLLRADHLTHLRCEVPAPNVIDLLDEIHASRPTHLISLMDHTPGQRQFRDLEKYFFFYGGKSGRGREMVEAIARVSAARPGRRAPWRTGRASSPAPERGGLCWPATTTLLPMR